ncbi:dihydrofolate reductase family protein [Kribbella sp. NPDC006257]|uniref:dihydrofolate reductase family protein n=1 Tax=Kribbella sp. NPDC006257 TaxID=3156738 RepID=UPI0033B834D6
MRKILESTFVSLDGVISNPQDYSPTYWDDEHFGYSASLMEGADAQLLGRVTYEGFADAWSQRTGEMADHFNNMKKYVASRTLTETTWNAELLQGDAVEAVRRLKESEGGNLIKFGTGEFSKALLDAKLVDEYHFWIFPVIAGSGDRLFDGLPMTHLDLLGTTTFKSGIVVHKLAPKA